MQLINRKPKIYHVSYITVEEFENEILNDSKIEAGKTQGRVLFEIVIAYVRLLNFINRKTNSKIKPYLFKKLYNKKKDDLFFVCMGLDTQRCLPEILSFGKKYIYIFDAWESEHKKILDWTEYWGINMAFVSSSQAAKMLSSYGSKCNFVWVPEGIKLKMYKYKPYSERDVDVLQLGRRYEKLHVLIADQLNKANKTYLYQEQDGKIIFPSTNDLIDGLSRTKISICYPKSITHPESAGQIETMTNRYLQSIVSKCLIVGHAPKEMIELFGYNPVIELDIQNPYLQIEEILNNYFQYTALIEKNYLTVVNNHTWGNRWELIKSVIYSKTK
jgi:hypothetical protein